MASRNNGLGNHPIIIIIGLISACIGIFVFASGYENIGQILSNLFSSSPPLAKTTSVVPTKTFLPTPIEVKAIAGNWVQVGLAGDTVSDLILADNTLYAATNGQLHGVYKSVDGGSNWAAINNGLGDLNVDYLVVVPNDSNIVYASTRNGVWRTSDAGKSWFPVDAPDSVITIASDNGEILYAARRYVEIWQSKDMGTSWYIVTRDFGWCNYMYSPRTNRSVLYCLQTYNLGGAHNSIYVSKDRGLNWLGVASVGAQYAVRELALSPENENVLYACMFETGIYKSTDGGGSWIPMNNGLPNQGVDLSCTGILVDPVEPNTVYTTFEGWGVWRTNDGGETWDSLSGGWDSNVTILSLGVTEDSQRYLFVGTKENGIWRSELP